MAEHAAQPEGEVTLREVAQGDLPVFFEYQSDPGAVYMAAFTPRDPTDREAFMEHWTRILADDTNTTRTVLFDGQVAGNIASFIWNGKREVGYWIGREYWGKGIATRALAAFLDVVRTRPLYANAAKDNLASIRVLQKCGFAVTGEMRSFATGRGAEIDEVTLELK